MGESRDMDPADGLLPATPSWLSRDGDKSRTLHGAIHPKDTRQARILRLYRDRVWKRGRR